ncbi:glycosyltransferase family 2 protein [Providencia rettgeri]|uniref:glycosyltransferase family 2 protein n=1 Tax=Providencia rettgeri TaxID=587 RepID=UPI0023AA5993|nr:glycosyltransferase family 2 protein [Providencia rettgeri]
MKLSIITVVFNNSLGLEKTINSLIEQDKTPSLEIEYIVVDGNSKDKTLEIIKHYYNLNIINKFISEDDNGIYDAMNKGIKLANGDWIIFLNSGDTFFDKKVLVKFNECLSNSEKNINFIYGDYISNNNVFSQSISLSFLRTKMINHQSIFYHHNLFKKSLYNTNYIFCADYAHLIHNYTTIITKKLNYCITNFDNTGISSQRDNVRKMWVERCTAVLSSDLNFYIKLFLISKGLIAIPFHSIRMMFKK